MLGGVVKMSNLIKNAHKDAKHEKRIQNAVDNKIKAKGVAMRSIEWWHAKRELAKKLDPFYI